METRNVVRIVVADDHPIFRAGLKALLHTEPGFQVVGESGDGLEAVRMAVELVPDILLLDVAMPNAGGLDALEQINRLAPSVRTLLLTASIDRDGVLKAVQCGARGVLLKEHATPLLFASIRAVLQGQYWVDREHVGQVFETVRDLSRHVPAPRKASNRFGLTARELHVIGGVKVGESNREIATRLSIREDTVKHHLSSIFDKLGVFSRVELAVFAINHGLEGDDHTQGRPLPALVQPRRTHPSLSPPTQES